MHKEILHEVEIIERDSLPQEDDSPENEAALRVVDVTSEPARRRWLPRLPKIQDPRQRRAGANILRFLAVILIFTLVARGTAASTLASVQTVAPGSSEIMDAVKASGSVSAAGSNNVVAPEGLTIKEILAGTGQKVTPKDPIARFDMDEVNDQLARAIATLNEYKLKLQQQERGEIYNGSALADAQNRADWAQQDLNSARSNGERVTGEAKAAMEAAKAASDAATAHYNSLPDGTTDEEKAAKAAALAAMQQAAEAHTAAAANYENTKRESESAITTAERGLASAKQGLAGAQTSDAEARRQAADTTAQNRVAAQTTRLNVEAQNKIVNELQKIADADGLLYPETQGTILQAATAGQKTTAQPLFRISEGTSGFEANLLVNKADAEKLSVGAPCEVRLQGGSTYYNPVSEGTVTSISEPDENGNVNVKVRLTGEDWKQSQQVEVNIIRSRETYNTAIPLSALRSDNSGYFVYVVQQKSTVLGTENTIVRVPVTLTAKDGEHAAIEGPISSEDKIVSNSSRPVQQGDSVRIAS